MVEVTFSKDSVDVRIPSEKAARSFRVIGSLRGIEIPELGVSLYGDDADLAKIANDLMAGRLDAESVELLKTISEFETQRQHHLVSIFAKGDLTQLKETINTMRAYDRFEQRGFEYFPASEQLLLVTYTLITFGKNGSALVDYVPFNMDDFNDWLLEGCVRTKERDDYTLSNRDGALLKAAEKAVPPQHVKTLRTLELISEFSRAKQKRLLEELKAGALPEERIEKLNKELNARYERQERNDEYRRLAMEFKRNGLFLNKKEKAVLAECSCHLSHWVYGGHFLLVKFETGTTIEDFLQEQQPACKGCRVFEIVVGSIDADIVVGRWIKTGKLSQSKYVNFKELNSSEIFDRLNILKKIAAKIDEPFRGWLNDFLVETKLMAYAGGESDES